MFLYFLRHASAGQSLISAKKDEKRGLDKDGIEQCGYIGRALAALGVQVEIIVSSPLKRSTQTAALVGNEMGHEGKLVMENALRPQASFSDFQKMLENTRARIPCCWSGTIRTCANFSDASSATVDAKPWSS
jgi:phosphohistidine phosphatase